MIKEIIYNNIEEPDYIYKKKEFSATPSSICDCKRKIFYRKLNHTQSNPILPPARIKMDVGNLIHDYIQKILQRSADVEYIGGEDLKSCECFGLTWWYRIDNAIKYNGNKYIIEVKSTHMTGWDEVQKEPKREHVLQMYLYMMFECFENGILLYFDRASGYMVEYQFTIHELYEKYNNILQSEIRELLKLKEQVNNNILPDRTFQACMKRTESLSWKFQKDNKMYNTDWHCNLCNYRDYCYNDIIVRLQRGQFYINGEII